ncbi:hypothetical protein EOD39_4921 [Acipenser ruthenus]|uniref:Uncharacterized protein n=1 Tax=Acipenser ruthenus TaxID=7906 RepID=A0A444UGD1_ACIRT|nr:hypothetical protein EOD39_4921 [Acipenser ruthenus]
MVEKVGASMGPAAKLGDAQKELELRIQERLKELEELKQAVESLKGRQRDNKTVQVPVTDEPAFTYPRPPGTVSDTRAPVLSMCSSPETLVQTHPACQGCPGVFWEPEVKHRFLGQYLHKITKLTTLEQSKKKPSPYVSEDA